MFIEHLTDPREHDPNNFLYIVTAIRCYGPPRKTKIKVHAAQDPCSYFSASLVGKLTEQGARQSGIGKDEVNHVATIEELGLILDLPYDGLVQCAWRSDKGVPVVPRFIKKYLDKHKGEIDSAYSLIYRPLFHNFFEQWCYNHLFIKGSPKTQVSGVYYLSPSENWPSYTRERRQEEASQIQYTVEEIIGKTVPVVELPRTEIKSKRRICA